MSISDSVRESMASSSWIRRMFEIGLEMKRKVGADNVFDLTLGNPTMEPPPEFEAELKRLIQNPMPGMHRYMENAGYPETRDAVARQLSIEMGVAFTADNVMMSTGAAAALNCILKTVLNRDEEVIVFAPFFAEYTHYINNHNGRIRLLPTDEQFQPDLNKLEASITKQTKAVLINSPNNPTGAVYNERIIRDLAGILLRKEKQLGSEIYLISDEPYRKIVYDGIAVPSVFRHYRRTLIANSYSKDLALPGERIGYIAIHPECPHHKDLMDGFVYCNRALGFVNAPAIMQFAIRKVQGITVPINEYQRKRDLLYSNLIDMGYSCVKPGGAFYLFPKSPTPDEFLFIEELKKHNVLVVPGTGFGTPGFFRVSYCMEDKTIQGSLNGFRETARVFGLC